MRQKKNNFLEYFFHKFVDIMIEKMAILQDSVLVGGFFFFLSTYLLWFSTKKINESQLKPNVKKNLNVLAFILMIIVVVIIFAYHSKHYMSSLSG